MYDTGLALLAKDVLLQLVSSCAQRNVTVLVDEAFIDYTPLHSLTAGPLPEDATLVIYMPGRDFDRIARELAAAGAKADTPCCAVSHAATARQTHAACRLRDLPTLVCGPAPLLLLIGRAVESLMAG